MITLRLHANRRISVQPSLGCQPPFASDHLYCQLCREMVSLTYQRSGNICHIYIVEYQTEVRCLNVEATRTTCIVYIMGKVWVLLLYTNVKATSSTHIWIINVPTLRQCH